MNPLQSNILVIEKYIMSSERPCCILPYSYAPLSYEWVSQPEATDIIYVHRKEFMRFAERMDVDGGGLIVSLNFMGCPYGLYTIPVRIGGYHTDDTDLIYGPSWMIESAGYDAGDLNTVSLSIYDEDIPSATSIDIVLMDVGSAIYSSETKEMFETALTMYGCIKKESAIQLHLAELDMTVYGFVTDVKPANIARFNGEVEVNIMVGHEEPKQKVIPIMPIPTEHSIPITPPSEPEFKQPSVEERRAAIRASWANRKC